MQGLVSSQTLKNDRAYKNMSMKLELEDHGRTALFHDGMLIDKYDDEEQAYVDGCNKYGLGNFSIIVIGKKRVINVGSLALNFIPESVDARAAEND